MATKAQTRILALARRQRRFHKSEVGADVDADIRHLVHEGTLTSLGRGWFALASLDPTQLPTLAAVAQRFPRGFFCLLTALRFHGMTALRPDEVWVAMDRRLGIPHIDITPIRFVRMSGPALMAGVQRYPLGQTVVHVTSPARTVVDCFRFRSKIGIELPLAALEEFRRLRKGENDEIWAHAEALRMTSIIRPHWALLL